MNTRLLWLSCWLSVAAGTAIADPVSSGRAATPAVLIQSGGDLRAVCPDVDQRLQESLVRVASRREMPTKVRMQMRVDGSRLSQVRAVGGFPDYRRAALRAVNKLACNAGGTPQVISFDIAFVDGDRGPTPKQSPVASR